MKNQQVAVSEQLFHCWSGESVEQAAGGEQKGSVSAKRWCPKALPTGQVDEVMDGTAAAGGIQAGCHICSTRTTGQTTNSSNSKQWDESFADVFPSVMENGPKLPMTPSDETMQLRTKMESPICSLSTFTNYGKALGVM